MYSQDVSAQLAFSYKGSTPILTIKYQNNTDQDIYFLSYFTPIQNYPGFYMEKILVDYADNPGKMVYVYEDITDQIVERLADSHKDDWFSVSFSPPEILIPEYCLLDVKDIDNAGSSDDELYSGINYDLNAVYDYLRAVDGTPWKKECMETFHPEQEKTYFTAEYVMEKQQYFIFIAKRGIINQEIDLRGFKILGGSFLFNFSPGDLPASIISGLNVGIPVSAQLPEIVNGYKLYHGPVKHNTIQLIFQ